MKNYCLAFIVILFFSCQSTNEEKEISKAPEVKMNYYGDSITTENTIDAKGLLALMNDKDSVGAKLETKIIECCKKKGCWMNVDMGEGQEPLTIRFKDYAFFVPTEGADGKMAVMEGVAYYDTLDVAYLKHMAEDAGKSKAAIDSITEPKLSLAFEAKGVIIKENPVVVN
jgi:Domain of unknown function (DUF4920)